MNLWQGAGSTGWLSGRYFSKSNPQPLTGPTYAPYEYVCHKCHNKFGEVLTIKEYETEKVHCPKCQGIDLEKVIELFFVKMERRTGGD